MKKGETEVRKTFLKIRVNNSEIQEIKKHQSKTTERSVSNYVRKTALQKPIIVKYRNESADDFLREMLQLRKELNGIGNNFNQAVHKLHILDRIPEFRNWIAQYDSLHLSLAAKVEEIKIHMNQLYEIWLQK